jgi:glycosyltransferase involved in cell wall biosynthesis
VHDFACSAFLSPFPFFIFPPIYRDAPALNGYQKLSVVDNNAAKSLFGGPDQRDAALQQRLKTNHMNKQYFGTLLDANAGIVVLNDYVNLVPLSKEIGKDLKRDIHIICGIWWSIELPKQLCKLIFIILRNRILYPKIKVSILCNTKREHQLLRLFRIDSVYCNHNCFIDENIFTISPGVRKKYDAVYNAVLSDFKRHDLVCDTGGKVAFITYKFGNAAYKSYLDETLKNITWLNYSSGRAPVFLDNGTVVKIYNESYTGLALSSVEGAMYASCEYLLCGVPVVSTASKGGRDVFFDDYNSIIAKAVPEQISLAVDELKAADKDAKLIRATAISRMNAHRQQFFKHVNKVLRSKGLHYDISDTWDTWFVNKLRNELNASDLLVQLNDRMTFKGRQRRKVSQIHE